MIKTNLNPFEGLENINKVKFEKPKLTLEQKLLLVMKSEGIKVQSVVLPPNFNEVRDEKAIIGWLRGNIMSLSTVNYEYKLKYSNQ
jgi:hypothetical protein